jgi:SAM-dependent methyltransferase
VTQHQELQRVTYHEILPGLRSAYDRYAGERDRSDLEPWKIDQRQRFIDLLRGEDKLSLLDIGAGTGKDSLFFQESGLDVTCIDLSPEMVVLCQQKGLRALERDFLTLDFRPATFDAAYALNSLLHVPKTDLPAVLRQIQTVVRPGGLFFLGVYGGNDFDGVWEDDRYEPKRFFSFYTDDGLQAAVGPFFSVVSFDRIEHDPASGLHVQALILRR